MSVSSNRISLLYVDDEPALLDLVKQFLEYSDAFDIETAHSGAEVLDMLQMKDYDGIISDYQMPEMNGIELLSIIRYRCPDLPFILFTGKGREEVVIQAIDAGADFYVQKGTDYRSQFRELGYKIKLAVEKRHVKKALKESEERYRNVVEGQTEFICRFLSDGTHSFVNEAYCRYFGMIREEIIGHRFVPEIPVEDKGIIRLHFASLTRDNPIGIIEHRVILPDGSVRWHQWSDRAIFDETGTLVEYQSIGRDITDRKSAELDLMNKNFELGAAFEQLAATEEELRTSYDDLAKSQKILENNETTLNAIISQSPIPQFVIDRDHKILYWNQALAANSGIAAKDMIGTDQHWKAFYRARRPCLADLLLDGSPEKISEYYPGIHAKSVLVDNAYAVTDFFPHMGSKGTWFHFMAGLIKNRNGDIIGAIESLEDITDRKTAELDLMKKNDEIGAAYEELTALEEELRNNVDELTKSQNALRKSEIQYRNVVEDQTEFICRFTPGGEHIFVNEAYCRYFNKQREDIIGKKFIPGIPNEDRYRVREHFASLTPKKPIGTIDHRIIMPDGAIRWQQWSDRVIFNDLEIPVEYQSVGRDITELKQVEEALRKLNNQINLMTSITRHDINNKITVILGYLDIAGKQVADPVTTGYLTKITAATNAIRTLIADTSTYQELGIREPQWQKLNKIQTHLPLPETISMSYEVDDIEIYADPMLDRVFFNLLDNSIRHGEHVTAIRLSSRQSDAGLIIVWEDNGIGVPKEEKEQIFERGFGKNTGLGMFFVREILSITGITIRETGTYGKGARFNIVVPEGGYRSGISG